MRKIRKRHSAELEHQSGNLLSTPQVLRLGCFIKKCMQFLYGHCLFLPDIHTGIYITKQSGDKTGDTSFHTTIVNTAQHSHIGRDRIEFQFAIVQILSVTSQRLASDLLECNIRTAMKSRKWKNRILIHMCRRIAPFFLQTPDIRFGTSSKSNFSSFLFHNLVIFIWLLREYNTISHLFCC